MNQSQQMNESLGHQVDEASDLMKFANQLMTAATRMDVAVNRAMSDAGLKTSAFVKPGSLQDMAGAMRNDIMPGVNRLLNAAKKQK